MLKIISQGALDSMQKSPRGQIPTCPPTGYKRIIKRLAAAGLSRILDHMLNGSFAIMSASIPGANNEQRTGELKEYIRDFFGYGFIDIRGSYMYEVTKEISEEDSVFIPGISEQDAKILATLFQQESYIYGNYGSWFQVWTRTGMLTPLGDIKDTFQPLRNMELGSDYSDLSQIRRNPNMQFRLDEELPEKRRNKDTQPARRYETKLGHRIVYEEKNPDEYCFYSISGNFRPLPPSGLRPFGIRVSTHYPEAGCLECWLPLVVLAELSI